MHVPPIGNELEIATPSAEAPPTGLTKQNGDAADASVFAMLLSLVQGTTANAAPPVASIPEGQSAPTGAAATAMQQAKSGLGWLSATQAETDGLVSGTGVAPQSQAELAIAAPASDSKLQSASMPVAALADDGASLDVVVLTNASDDVPAQFGVPRPMQAPDSRSSATAVQAQSIPPPGDDAAVAIEPLAPPGTSSSTTKEVAATLTATSTEAIDDAVNGGWLASRARYVQKARSDAPNEPIKASAVDVNRVDTSAAVQRPALEGKAQLLPSAEPSNAVHMIDPGGRAAFIVSRTPLETGTDAPKPDVAQFASSSRTEFPKVMVELTMRDHDGTPLQDLRSTRPSIENAAEFAVKSVRYLLKEPGQTIHVRLVPESLGELRIAVTTVDDVVQVQLAASSPAVRDLFHQQQHVLRESLAKAGIDVSNIAVSADVSGGSSSNTAFARDHDTASTWHRTAPASGAPNKALVQAAASLLPRAVHHGRLDLWA